MKFIGRRKRALLLGSLLSLLPLLNFAAENIELAMTSESSQEFLKLVIENRNLLPTWAEVLDENKICEISLIQSIKCIAKVKRPASTDDLSSLSSDPEALAEFTQNNRIECEIVSNTGQALSMKLSLQGNLLDRWGTPLEKLPFTIKGPLANALFKSLQTTYNLRGESDPMYYSLFVCEPTGRTCLENYFINQYPNKEQSPLSLACGRTTEVHPELMAHSRNLFHEWLQTHPMPSDEDWALIQNEIQNFWKEVLGEGYEKKTMDEQLAQKINFNGKVISPRLVLKTECLWLNIPS